MKRNCKISLAAALLGTAMTANTMAQVGGASGTGAGSRGGATIGGTTGSAPSTLTSPLGTDRQQLDAAPAFRAQGNAPGMIPDVVAQSSGMSNTPAPSSQASVPLPVRPSVSLLAARAMLGIGTRSSNPACTGTSADADVCKGWE